MNRDNTMALIVFLILHLALFVQPLAAAEVRGTVSIDYKGLFENSGGDRNHRVSVALLPAEGQHTEPRGVRRQHVEIVNNRMQPAFLTVQKGDSIEFINRDKVYHELFSLSAKEPVTVRLGKADDRDRARTEFRLDHAGTTHFFCRIHSKSYARIDVVETPHLQMIQPGGRFQFVGLAPGLWRLRLAAPASETKWLDVAAMTSPPPLRLTLTSRSGGSGSQGPGSGADAGQLYRRLGDLGNGQ